MATLFHCITLTMSLTSSHVEDPSSRASRGLASAAVASSEAMNALAMATKVWCRRSDDVVRWDGGIREPRIWLHGLIQRAALDLAQLAYSRLL